LAICLLIAQPLHDALRGQGGRVFNTRNVQVLTHSVDLCYRQQLKPDHDRGSHPW
jgi:hypothetical protein